MNPRYLNILASVSALLSGGALMLPQHASAQQQGIEELTRGPIHEAFASSVSYNPEPGILIRQSPPEMIEEIPPSQRLEGDNVSWIPGYWAWDEDQGDFIWISGIWRKLPPGRQWNPGYWGQVDDQSQWTSGYWSDEEAQEVAYLPRPPRSLETGPNIAAPSENDIWVSGNWIRRNDRYGWTPGYWEPARQDWIWIPAHYQWTRRGYVFIDGYWDYNVSRRGVMFAPVRFRGDDYRRPGYSYTPILAISLNVLLDHLFVRPSYGHYYFGDYYRPSYRDNGYYSSQTYYSGRNGYDPIYSHNRWEHRDDRDWDRNRTNDFNYYRDNESARPAHTWAEAQDRPSKGKDKRENYVIAQPLDAYAKQADSGQRFEEVSEKSREEYVEQRKKLRDFGQERSKREGKPEENPAKGSDDGGQVSREKIEKSPLAAKRSEQLKGKDVPPDRPAPADSDRDAPGKRDGQSTDKPAKEDKEKGRTPDRDKDKDPNDMPKEKDTKRPEAQPEPKREREPEAKPEEKPKERKPTPDRPSAPEPDKGRKTEERKADPQREAKPEPEPRKKQEQEQRSRPEPQKEAKPERRAKPEPEAAPEPRPSREQGEKSPDTKDEGDGNDKKRKK